MVTVIYPTTDLDHIDQVPTWPVVIHSTPTAPHHFSRVGDQVLGIWRGANDIYVYTVTDELLWDHGPVLHYHIEAPEVIHQQILEDLPTYALKLML